MHTRFRRCILPVDGFYEWEAIKGQRAKQPYAIAMKDRLAIRDCGRMGELEGPSVR
jgi:putative SOS response-associated peptidase YedK